MTNNEPSSKEKSKFRKWDLIIGILLISNSIFKLIVLIVKKDQQFEWYSHGFSMVYLVFGCFLVYRNFYMK